MNKILIQNPRIINEGRSFIGSVLVEGDKIAAVFEGEVPGNVRAEASSMIRCISGTPGLPIRGISGPRAVRPWPVA